jgi:hypothetical protein
MDQDDNFAQFLGQIATLFTNGRIVDWFFETNPVFISMGKKDWKEVRDHQK